MHATQRTSIAAALVLCLGAACAPAASEGREAPSRFTTEPRGVVEVRNDGIEDVVIYLARGGTTYRLGRVSRMETARFSMPRFQSPGSARVALIARPVGTGSPFTTSTLLLRHGQNLSARLGRNSMQRTFDMVIR